MHFGHSVDRPGTLDTEVWRRVAGRVVAKCTDGAGYEESELILLAQLHDIVDALNVDAHCEGYVALANRREE